MRRHTSLARVALGLAVLACPACELAPRAVEVTLELPPLPPAWLAAFPEVGCRIDYVDRAGRRVRADYARWEEAGAGEILLLAPNSWVPVLATPVVRSLGVDLLPAGAVAPLDVTADASRIAASWERGALARLLARLLAPSGCPGLPVEWGNADSLGREMAGRGGGDPWAVDAEALARSLLRDGYAGRECRPLPVLRVVIPPADVPGGPATRALVSDSPLAPVATCGDDGGLEGAATVDLAAGFHRLFPVPAGDGADRSWLDLTVAADGAVWIRRRPAP